MMLYLISGLFTFTFFSMAFKEPEPTETGAQRQAASLAKKKELISRGDQSFYVYNGGWVGTYDDYHILVHETEKLVEYRRSFREVLSITDSEHSHFHLGNSSIVVEEIDEEDEIPF